MGLKRRRLDDSARRFLVDRLEASGPLGERIASIDLRPGTVFTIADAEVPIEQLHSFHHAGVATQGPFLQGDGYRIQQVQRPSEDAVGDLLAACLAEDVTGCVIAEEGLAEPADRWLSKLTESGLVVAPFGPEDVFLVVLPGGNPRSAIATLLRNVNAFFGFIAVGRADHDVPWSQLEAQDLERLASDVRLIAVPAYDAEGYVLWEAGEA